VVSEEPRGNAIPKIPEPLRLKVGTTKIVKLLLRNKKIFRNLRASAIHLTNSRSQLAHMSLLQGSIFLPRHVDSKQQHFQQKKKTHDSKSKFREA